MKILNTWTSKKEDLNFYYEENLVFELGEYKIFKQWGSSYLYTYKDIAINQLVGLNKELVKCLNSDSRPLLNGEYSPQTFLFDRAKDSLKKGLELIKN